MIRRAAWLAATCVVLIPALAFSGDIDGETAWAMLWPRLLVIAVLIGLPLLAIHLAAGRPPPPELDEYHEQAGASSISPALAGLYGGLTIAALTVGYIVLHNHPWVRGIRPSALTLGVLIPMLLILAWRFDGRKRPSGFEPDKDDEHGG